MYDAFNWIIMWYVILKVYVVGLNTRCFSKVLKHVCEFVLVGNAVH